MKRLLAGLLSLVPLHAVAAELPAEHFARVGGNELAWECRGEGNKTVVLIAGMGLDAHATYKNTFRNFAVPGYQVCLYDRAGVGRSTPQSTPRPLRALADELDGRVRERGWRDVVLVAHSFGGLIAQKLLAGEHASAAIAIDPGQIKGVKPVPFAQIRSARRLSSVAARRENVIRSTRYGSAPLTSRWATRCASAFVLPEPAPAMTSNGPVDSAPSAIPCSTARRCSGFSWSR